MKNNALAYVQGVIAAVKAGPFQKFDPALLTTVLAAVVERTPYADAQKAFVEGFQATLTIQGDISKDKVIELLEVLEKGLKDHEPKPVQWPQYPIWPIGTRKDKPWSPSYPDWTYGSGVTLTNSTHETHLKTVSLGGASMLVRGKTSETEPITTTLLQEEADLQQDEDEDAPRPSFSGAEEIPHDELDYGYTGPYHDPMTGAPIVGDTDYQKIINDYVAKAK